MSAARAEFLGAMRRVANSVAIVTTDGACGRHGATVTSFCSVSADPPSLLVCLRGASRIARAVTGNRAFCVNVLQAGATALADRFAGRGDPLDRFAGVRLIADALPRLAEAAASFSCHLIDTVDAGSHVIVVGHVADVRTVAEPPLAYLDGEYVAISRNPWPTDSGSNPCQLSV
jgi:flavin reductase (DIM6/NTAB) family NADH-FMN oxidoreductase RutF